MLINGFFAPAAGGSANSIPLCWWQGWSGRWYVTSRMALSRRACDAPGVFVLVRRGEDGFASPLAVGSSDDIERTLRGEAAEALAAAAGAGANEIHVNLVGSGRAERDHAAFDIARAWTVPVWH